MNAAASLPLLGRAQCGNCVHSRPSGQLGQIVCYGAPPTPCIVGMTAAGPNIAVIRPQLRAEEDACALFARRFATAKRVALEEASEVAGSA